MVALLVNLIKERSIGIFGSVVLTIFKIGFSLFAVSTPKTSLFRFWCSSRFADFPFFSIWCPVFAKNTNEFSDLISDAVLIFPI